MSLRRSPAVAAWFLKLFCSGREDESLIGDLTEQYQRGHGRLWYWRQVLNIVWLEFQNKTVRRPLVPKRRIPVAGVFVAIMLIMALYAVLVSDITTLLLLPILAGIVFALARSEAFRHTDPDDSVSAGGPTAPETAQINSARIPVSGGAGAGIVIVVLLSAVLYDLPLLRFLALPGILAGLFLALITHFWRKRHVPAPSVEPLNLRNGTAAVKTRPR